METIYQSVPVQDEAVNRAKDAQRFMFLDAPGAGKTRMALRWWRHQCQRTKSALGLIVSLPVSAYQTWASEVKRFDSTLRVTRNPKCLTENCIALLSHRRSLDIEHPYVLIVDEAHVAKNRQSKVHQVALVCELCLHTALVRGLSPRTWQVIARLAEHATCIAILTGSPLINDVRDWASLWSLLMGPMHYTANPYWWDAREESCQQIVSAYTSRIQKHELSLVPPTVVDEYIRLQPVVNEALDGRPLPPVNERAFYRARATTAHVFELAKAVHFELPDVYASQGAQRIQYMNERLARCRDLVTVRHALDSCIVFSHFIPLLEAAKYVCERAGAACTVIHSHIGLDERERRIDAFRKGIYRVLFISIKTGGVSLNLQCANVCVFLDQAYCKEHMKQGLSRVHRFQQTQRVFVYNIVCRYTLDQVLMGLQNRKEAVALRLMGLLSTEEAEAQRKLVQTARDLIARRDALQAVWWLARLLGKLRHKRRHRV